MNDSGRAVQAAVKFFKLDPDAVLVVHDEGDLERGRLQARIGGGAGGHNGLRSIVEHLGTPEFMRLRVGVGRPGRGDQRKLADYLLADFRPEDDPEGLVRAAAKPRSARSTPNVRNRGHPHTECAPVQRKRASAGGSARLAPSGYPLRPTPFGG
jgi:aminoacyl-tRNA hydrolase